MGDLIKLLHTADLHLDSPLRSLALRDEDLRDMVQTATRAALSKMVSIAIEEEVAALLIAGDLFDGQERSAKTASFLVGELERLKEHGISVFYIKGNHDAENPVSGAFALPDNVHVFDGRGGKIQMRDSDVWIHGVSFSGKHVADSLLHKYDAPVSNAVNIGMMHTSLAGAAGHDLYAPCTVAQLVDHGFDYWALGHVHKRTVHSERPFVVMPGMPQGRDIGEAGPKSATLLKIENGEIELEEMAVSQVEFRVSHCDLSEIEEADGLRAHLRAHLQEEAKATVSDAAVLRVALTGAPVMAWEVQRDFEAWEETIRELAREMECLWLEKLVLDFREDGEVETGADVNAVKELAVIMNALKSEEGFRLQMVNEFELLRSQLPAERRGALLPDQTSADQLLDELMEEATEMMLARMKGAAS